MEINKAKLIELLEDDYGTGYWKGEEESSKFITKGIFLMRADYDHLIDSIKQCAGENSHESAALPSHDVSVSICSCEMPVKVKGKNECWRCKKPFKEFLQTER